MIVLTNNRKHEFQIDAEDFAKIFPYSWCLHSAGYIIANVPVKDKRAVKQLLLHHCILGKPNRPLEIDHINGDKKDNRKINLRIVTSSQNKFNSRKKFKRTTSKYIGVYFHKRTNKFFSQIQKNKIRYTVGLYDSEIEAAKARDLKAIEFHGEFAKLNFPDK